MLRGKHIYNKLYNPINELGKQPNHSNYAGSKLNEQETITCYGCTNYFSNENIDASCSPWGAGFACSNVSTQEYGGSSTGPGTYQINIDSEGFCGQEEPQLNDASLANNIYIAYFDSINSLEASCQCSGSVVHYSDPDDEIRLTCIFGVTSRLSSA